MTERHFGNMRITSRRGDPCSEYEIKVRAAEAEVLAAEIDLGLTWSPCEDESPACQCDTWNESSMYIAPWGGSGRYRVCTGCNRYWAEC